MIRWMLAILFIGFAASAEKAPQVLFGPEFTFAPLDNGEPDPDSMQKWVVRHLITKQPKDAKFRLEERWLASPEGWAFTVLRDPGVIEVPMDPMTAKDFVRFADNIQDGIFVSAGWVEHYPALFMGGGHINVELKQLMQRPLLLRNFIVDLLNHNELFLGIFGYDTSNAIAFDLMTHDTRGEILKLIEDFDYLFDHGPKRTLEYSRKFLDNLSLIFHHSRDSFAPLWSVSDSYNRGREVAWVPRNIERMTFDPLRARLELRAVRPQASAHVFARQVTLLQKRIDHLATLNRPLRYRPKVKLVPLKYTLKGHGLNPPVRVQDALAAFHEYILESGEEWINHRDYVWPAWISSGAVERYEKSGRFKQMEARFRCERELTQP